MILVAFLAAATATVAPAAIRSEDGHVDFAFSWSAEAEAVPALRRRFRADAIARRQEALRTARVEEQLRRPSGVSHLFHRDWTTKGQTLRLLSLLGSTTVYTGGAHQTSGTTALLWDRQRTREITFRDLLRPGQDWSGAIRQPFCTLLDRERADRRKERIVRGEWPNQCPALSELTLALFDRDSNGRFDHVEVIADPYVAGSYAEGAYTITLPLTATMLARLRPEFRTSFEPQPPVQ
jgi:hypothetical protein